MSQFSKDYYDPNHSGGQEDQSPNERQYTSLKQMLEFTRDQRNQWEKRALDAEAKLRDAGLIP
jgi:hypothetical protein